MMQRLTSAILIVVAVLVAGAYFCTYTVRADQRAAKYKLGSIVETNIPPGLHLKWPFVNTIRKFDARVQTLDSQPERVLTSEQKNLSVDTFVKWRIHDLKTYITRVGGSPDQANGRLSEIVRDALKSEFSQRTIREVVSGERTEVMRNLTQRTRDAAEGMGVEVVDVRIKRIDLPPAVQKSVFDRMRTEREQVAEGFRARGSQEAEKIHSETDNEAQVIVAKARAKAARLRGEGESQAAETYAKAYGKDPDFYAFYRSMQAYTATFSDPGDVLVLSPKSEFFRFFQDKQGAGK